MDVAQARKDEEKLAAINNEHTPIVFLLYLYRYPEEKEHSTPLPGASDVFGPGSLEDTAPTVTDEIREAAGKALAQRDWELSWVDPKLDLRVELLVRAELKLARVEYEFNKKGLIDHLSNGTPLDKATAKLLGFLKGTQ